MNIDLTGYFSEIDWEKWITAALILIIGLILIYGISFLVKKIIAKKISRQAWLIINRVILFTGYLILVFIIFSELEINLAALFGAAGVLGIIIGVASQTSIGNIVSGLFLVSEKPFEVGDLIQIGDKTGFVYSMDLLSIKVRTFDNLLIRIPNQTVISTEVVNVTKFPIRRMDITVSVAYKEDLRKVVRVLEDVSKKNPLCLDEPEPLIIFQGYGSSSIDILLGVWFEKDNFKQVKNSIIIEIKEAFDRENIEIPFPHISLYAGEKTKPFPVEKIE